MTARSPRRPPGCISRRRCCRRWSRRGVRRVTITLHVGAGTFLPVRTDDVAQHHMHAERGEITPQAAAAINAAPSGVVAVGTTSLRLLETAASDDGCVRPFAGDTDAVHRAGLPVPRRRSAADQLPSAALDAVHAGLRLRRHRADARGLCARDRGGLSLLFLWRRVPVWSGMAAHATLPCKGRADDVTRSPIASPPPTAPRAPACCTPRMATCQHQPSCRSAPPAP